MNALYLTVQDGHASLQNGEGRRKVVERTVCVVEHMHEMTRWAFVKSGQKLRRAVRMHPGFQPRSVGKTQEETGDTGRVHDMQVCCMDMRYRGVRPYAWLMCLRSPRDRGLLRIHRKVLFADYDEFGDQVLVQSWMGGGRMDLGTMDGGIEN